LASGSHLGNIESGVYVVFERLGIKEPKTALEWQAIDIAQRLDKGVDEHVLASVHRELRLILDGLATQPHATASTSIDKLIEGSS
jgi:hypothetical protein